MLLNIAAIISEPWQIYLQKKGLLLQPRADSLVEQF